MVILLERLQLALATGLSAEDWLITLGLTVVFAVLSLLIIRASGLFELRVIHFNLGQRLLIMLVAFFSPSLVEELVYRVLLLPHTLEAVTWETRLGWSLLSLSLYVLAHPFIARFLWSWSRRIFYRPSFLLIVTLLGVTCTAAYLLTGSVWSPVLIHWVTIVAWKFYLGGPDFGLSEVQG